MEKFQVLGLRIAAFFIDMTFIMVIMFGAGFLIGIDRLNNNVVLALGYMCFILLLYFNKDIINGESIGKKLLRLKIYKIDGGESSKILLFIRNLFLIIWFLELIVILINNKGKRLGDIITKTEIDLKQ